MDGLVQDPFSDADKESKEMEKGEKQKEEQSEEKRYCTYCARELKKGVDKKLFCPKCGYKPAEETAQQPQQSSQPNKDPEQEKKEKFWMWVRVGFYALAGIGIIIMSFFLIKTAREAMNIFPS